MVAARILFLVLFASSGLTAPIHLLRRGFPSEAADVITESGSGQEVVDAMFMKIPGEGAVEVKFKVALAQLQKMVALTDSEDEEVAASAKALLNHYREEVWWMVENGPDQETRRNAANAFINVDNAMRLRDGLEPLLLIPDPPTTSIGDYLQKIGIGAGLLGGTVAGAVGAGYGIDKLVSGSNNSTATNNTLTDSNATNNTAPSPPMRRSLIDLD